jgi:predicted Zn finger-like uncharacterized protein
MELICPSCEARYRVPEGAIGGRGRQVSCTNCGHGWHAVPPLVLGAATRTLEPALAGADREAPVQPGRHGEHGQHGHVEHQPGRARTAEIHSLRPTEPSRVAQLAEIREMIAQVQSDERAPGAAAGQAGGQDGRHAVDTEIGRVPNVHAAPPHAPAAPAAPGGTRTRSELRRDDAAEGGEPLHQDPLRRRMAEHDARAARERDERERLRRSMKHGTPETKAGSGAFLSGFLLVVLVAAALLAAYLLHDEIAARLPASAPILAEYVEAMNDLRVAIAESYERARAWVMDMISAA